MPESQNTAVVQKFTFDTVFEDNGRVIAPVRPKKTFTAEEVEAIRKDSFAEGERSATAIAQQAQTMALQQIAAAAQGALSGLAMVAHEHRAGSARLALAMKGASDTLRDLFFSNMSERAAKIMRDDMEAMGPVRLKDVDLAQMAMVQVAKDLAAKGEIMLAGQGGEDELVY